MKQISFVLIAVGLFFAITPSLKAQVNKQDSLALVDFYDSTGGSSWTTHTNWLTKLPVSKWYGITLDAGNRVSRIRVTGNNLKGILPASFYTMTNLTYLAFGNNSLRGSVSPNIGNLVNLQTLFLWGNQFTGSIPSTLGNLTGLVTFEISQNKLTGSIPSTIGNLVNLQTLYLWSNNLTGVIPGSIGNLTSLQLLDFSSNQLSGSIPSSMGSLISLTSLNLGGNKLSGFIPDLRNLTSLKSLFLYNNLLFGNIPNSLGNLTNLTTLYLWGNQLGGSIPDTLGNLTNLVNLALSSNSLTGSIPQSIGNLTSLSYLSLWGNQLTGSIPDTLGNLTNLRTLYLNSNQLSGNIPATLGNLYGLSVLYLWGNQLTGSIPTSLGYATNLASLALNNNLLNGTIPSSIMYLSNLKSLWLNNNQFTFAGMEQIIPSGFADSIKSYSPQSIVPIIQNGNQLIFSVGGTPSNNTYQWYKDGNLVSTKVGDSTFTVTSNGQYYVIATNAVATNLVLYSNTLNIADLPVKSIALQANEVNGHVQLNWQTIGELNTTLFTIQRSVDAKSFTDINSKNAVGNGSNNYEIADNSPVNGNNYYRIKSLDKLGMISYSKVVSIQMFTKNNQLTIYPNPTTDKVTITGNHIATISLRNNIGKLITNVQLKDASNPSLPVTNLAEGTYYLQIRTTTGEEKVISFVKK